jgi:hypothetical protein
MNRGRIKRDKSNRIFEAKKILPAVALTLALPALMLCQTNGKNADKKSAGEQAVRQTLDELAAGLGNNDTAVLERIYADDYVFVGDTGLMDQSAADRRL